MDEYNDAYHGSIRKKLIHADFSSLSEEIKSNYKNPKFKVADKVKLTKHKKSFSNWSGIIFVIDSVLKSNYETYKIKDSHVESKIGHFYEKICC